MKKFLFIKNKKFWVNIFLFIPLTFIFDLFFLFDFTEFWQFCVVISQFIILIGLEFLINRHYLKAPLFGFLTSWACLLFFSFLPNNFLLGLKHLEKLEEINRKESQWFPMPGLVETITYIYITCYCLSLLIIAIIIYFVKRGKLPFIKTKKFWVNIFLFIPLTFIFDLFFLLPFLSPLLILFIELGILLGLEFYLNKTFLKTAFFSFLTSGLCFLLFLFLEMDLPGQRNLERIEQKRNEESDDIFSTDWTSFGEIASYIILIIICLSLLFIASIRYLNNRKMPKNY
jgi:hypothetical protein